MQSYRRKCRKFQFVNSAPAEQGARTAAGVFAPNGRHLFLHRLSGAHELRRRFALTGGEFSLNLSGGCAAAATGTTPYPRRWAKRKGHLRFPFLFELLPFPCFLIWRRLPTCDRFETGVRQRIFSSVSFETCPQGQITFCYTCGLVSAGATYPCCATLWHVVTHGTYELSVWYNLSSQTLSIITRSRIARHCHAAPCAE